MDKERFVQESERYAGMLYRIAWTILRNEEDCQDALQDAALKAWEKRNTLREPSYFGTWMTRIVINCCRDTQRKRSRVFPVAQMPEAVSPPEDVHLAMLLQELPEKLRVPLVLHCSEGMSCQEIAAVLRLPETTVRGRIQRARMKLREELDEHEATC